MRILLLNDLFLHCYYCHMASRCLGHRRILRCRHPMVRDAGGGAVVVDGDAAAGGDVAGGDDL